MNVVILASVSSADPYPSRSVGRDCEMQNREDVERATARHADLITLSTFGWCPEGDLAP